MSRFAQDTKWYDKNNSRYRNSIIKFGYLANGNEEMRFLPGDLVQFGKIIQVPFPGSDEKLWILKIPKGMQVYHASRSLAVNNSEYPLLFDINKTLAKNKAIEDRRIANLTGNVLDEEGNVVESNVKCYHHQSLFTDCIANTYYAGAPEEEYLHKDNSYLGRQIRYSFGLDTMSDDTALKSVHKLQYNDRIAEMANEHGLGVAAYKTTRDSYFVAIPDDFFINRGFLGVRNTVALLRIIYQDEYDLLFKDQDYGDPILSSSGLSLGANLRYWEKVIDTTKKGIIKWFSDKLLPFIIAIDSNYNDINFDHIGTIGVIYRAMRQYHQEFWMETESMSADQIKKEFRRFLNVIYDQDAIPKIEINKELIEVYGRPVIPGIRMSEYVSDRPLHTQIRELLIDKELTLSPRKRKIKIDGILGGLLYNPRWCPFEDGDKICIPEISNGLLTPTNEYGFFNSEMIAFYAPDVLERDYKNKLDFRYKLNELGVLTEFRKYKTTNILKDHHNFHQGHLYEHSSWVALQAQMLDKDLRSDLRRVDIDPAVILTAALLHDVGKAGRCKYTTPPKYGEPRNPKKEQIGIAYQDYNPHTIPKPYWCDVIRDGNNELGFTYYDQPVHPEEGYRILKGLRPFTMYSFKGDTQAIEEDYNLVSRDWDAYQKAIGFTEWYQMKVVRIAVACHWDFGPVASDFRTNPSSELVLRYIHKIERYYNAEFGVFDLETFIRTLYITMVVSAADIYGVLYDPSLNPNDPDKIYNNYPNYHIFRSVTEFIANFLVDIHAGTREGLEDFVSATTKLLSIEVIVPVNDVDTTIEFSDALDQIVKEPNPSKRADGIELLYKFNHALMMKLSQFIFSDFNIQQEFKKFIEAPAIYYADQRNKQGELPAPRIYAETVRSSFKAFFNLAVEILQTYKPNPLNTFMVLDNLLHSYENVLTLYSGHRKFAPKALIFDLDATLLLQGPNLVQNDEYTYYTDVPLILQTCQYLRQRYGVKLAIASRHYIPKRLLDELVEPNSPLYYKNFDIIVSQYTGPVHVLFDYCNEVWTSNRNNDAISEKDAAEQCNRYLEPCDASSRVRKIFREVYDRDGKESVCKRDTHGFIIYEGKYYIGDFDEQPGKGPHMKAITQALDLAPEEMMLFDDGIEYVTGEQLGGHNVYTAGIDGKYGLTSGLFYTAIAMFIYEKFVSNDF